MLRSGEHRFVLHAAQAREVARIGEIAELPGAPERVAGVTSIRGQVLPVLDLRRVIEAVPSVLGPDARLVTLRAARPVALLVEEVSDLVEVSLEDLLIASEAPPDRDAPPVRGTLALPGAPWQHAAVPVVPAQQIGRIGSGLLSRRFGC